MFNECYKFVLILKRLIKIADEVLEQIGAVYSNKRILIPSLSEANSLYQDGFGSMLEGNMLVLRPIEALYLTERERITVIDKDNRVKMTFQDILQRFSEEDWLLWTRYIVYRDLRSRGFVVREIPGDDIRFHVYERGSYGKKPPRYAVYTISEGISEPLDHLYGILASAEMENKILRIAVIDRRGEIVYYTLSEINFEKDLEEWKDL
ncbi:hypothetical protein KEJ47_08030 [Candidatus Bathyarchaeota archaeon]|nr:hypothetical protein [Candidatus Bathyarchaeota archaeon]